jgi:phospholipid/cholesterol/gamma-HCH transport system substrate-binding protein
VDRKVRLPDNATAAIRQTSLLGEKFVALAAPTTEPAQGSLSDGDVIPLSRTGRSAEVEEVLAALGMVLSGGGLAQLKTINEELAKALAGRETDAKDALHQLDAFIGGLDAQKADIVRALDALDHLAGRLADQRVTIGAAVDALAPGLTVLAQQRAQLTTALTALGDLGTVGTRVVNASRDDTLASIRALQPILDQLVRAGSDLPKALEFMLTYPFPPNVTGAIVGNFVNLRATADLDAAAILANLLVAPAPAPAPKPGAPAPPGLPRVPGLPNVPTLPGVPGVPCVPGVPPVPGVPCTPGPPCVPGIVCVPPVPCVPGLPCPPAVPPVPGLPGVPGLPSGLPAPTGEVYGEPGVFADLLGRGTGG